MDMSKICSCGKLRYSTFAEALDASKRIAQRSNARDRREHVEPYWSNDCQAYHLAAKQHRRPFRNGKRSDARRR